MRLVGSRSLCQLLVAGSAMLIRLMATRDKLMAPLMEARDPHLVIPNRYIVILKDNHDDAGDNDGDFAASIMEDHHLWLTNLLQDTPDDDVKLEHHFDIEGLRGYSGKFSPTIINAIRTRREVKYVERDQLVYALDMVEGQSRRRQLYQIMEYFRRKDGSPRKDASHEPGTNPLLNRGRSRNVMKQLNAPWGLSRVSHSEMPIDLTKYHYPRTSGKGVDVYVIDTGINIAHSDFDGRAQWGVTIPEDDIDIDGNGHGTHCAGIIAAQTYGIAKKANVIAVKVLRTNGFGTNADVIKGVEWTIKAARAGHQRGRKSVANMSLGGGKSLSLEAAVDRAVRSGVHFAVAAGNDNEDACDYSPAGAEGPIAVGASTSRDQMAFFSNHGPCVDIFAPGMDITSTWIGSRRAINTISGTSMASPHVAGVLALYLAERSYEPSELKKLLIQHANTGLLEDIPYDTGNFLVSTHRLLESMGQ